MREKKLTQRRAKTEIKRALIFDLYGTMIDIRTDEEDQCIYNMLSRYLSYHMINITPEELRSEYFGNIQRNMTKSKEIYPEVDIYKIFFDILYRYGRKRYHKNFIIDIAMLFRSLTIRHFGVFDGLYDALGTIVKKYKTAIVSDAQWVFAEPEMAMLGLDQFFEQRILSSRIGYKKPDSRLFHLAAQKLGVKPENTIYIGDNPEKDAVGAKKAGMRYIMFNSGRDDIKNLQPEKCFNNYRELENILNEMI